MELRIDLGPAASQFVADQAAAAGLVFNPAMAINLTMIMQIIAIAMAAFQQILQIINDQQKVITP